MSKRIGLLSIVVLLVASLAACTTAQAAAKPAVQAVPMVVAQAESLQMARIITVVGEGKVSLKPDIATINVGADARADTVSEAKAEVDAQMASILAALQEAGIAEADIQTSHYSIYYDQQPMPVTPGGSASQSQGGYRVSSTVQVTVRDVEKAGNVLDAVVQAGANQVHGVTFTVSDESTWQSEARAEAMTDARDRAQELAGLAGVELGEVVSVSEVIGGIPTAMVGVRQGMGGGGIAPGELELGTQIQVAFAIQ
jgi:uncharacterized protein YggE